MSEFREESEQHVVHRLEAFSDIVIGFSLAQLTYNLVLPADVLDLFTKNSLSLVAFAATFGVVAGMWWNHHRLFTNYFVPTRLNIALNFLSLGGVLFLVYSLQVWLHSQYHRDIAYVMYSGALAWVLGIIAFLMYRGTVLRGAQMDPELRSRGRWHAFRISFMAVAFSAVAVLNAVWGLARIHAVWVLVIVLGAIALVRIVEGRVRHA